MGVENKVTLSIGAEKVQAEKWIFGQHPDEENTNGVLGKCVLSHDLIQSALPSQVTLSNDGKNKFKGNKIHRGKRYCEQGQQNY